MSNEQSPAKRIWEKIKLLLALAPAGLLFAMFTYSLIEMFDWDVNINIWLFSAVWMFLLLGFVKGGVDGEKDWERVGILWLCVFYGFIGTVISFFLLGILLQWTLNIDIQEFDRFYYLMNIVWIGWIIGVYFAIKHKWQIF